MSLRRVGRTAVMWAALAGCATTEVLGQAPEVLVRDCADAGASVTTCAAGVVAGRALMGGLGVLSGGGAEIPGTASNLGARVGGGPRLSLFGRLGWVDVGLPDLGDPASERESTFGITGLQVGAAAGLFDGFRIMPTVGGFLSVDVFASATFHFLPSSEGLAGGGTAFTGGARIGVLREGFTVPGVSVSVSQRFVGEVSLVAPGPTPGADPSTVRVDPDVTSVRAAVSKDLFAVELMAGWGWDRYGGDVGLEVPHSSDPSGVDVTGALEDTRHLFFGGASMTFGIVLTIAVEGGWTGGFEDVAGYDGAHDPTSGGAFGSVAIRLTS